MDITLCPEIPELKIASTMMFGYPTGMVDTWFPSVEHILLPGRVNPSFQVEVKAASGTATWMDFTSWKRKAYHAIAGALRGRKALDYTGKFIFDARFDTYRNMAHILDNVATRILFARALLSDHLHRDIDIHVILAENAAKHKLPNEAYRLLGIPTIFTNEDVVGEVVTVSNHQIFSVKPKLFDIDLPNPKDLSIEKVFVPRRGNRSLINNEELRVFLEQQGFQTCYFEDFSIAEQWAIARNAKIVVAVHGAAVSTLIFNRLGRDVNANPFGGVKVVEILSPSWVSPLFRDMVNAVNGSWCAVRGQVTPDALRALDFSGKHPDSLKSPYKDPFKVNCETVQMALDYLDKAEKY